ncbi:DNA cytosine methyltransferase [Hymenobacter sp. BRD67]|uniref:DNA cytosine methyltransferase n=1 Tax=Hymenobacter sp. BRD67 TaxID=2675877 RepID=UPI0015677BF9|nr:DNA cytosine methyltransferase [Hymenobacter sp. BRD67]QKG52254.1 DNA cytosine methyltransferase [Hymenobacter sp. BRD67]
MPAFYEFFAGGGMARAGLGPGWQCLFANDFDEMKGATYAANWGADDLLVGDIANVTTQDLPGAADLAWASSPCQDLSLAGNGGGLGLPDAEVMTRSGTFWRYIALMHQLAQENRAPKLVIFENVVGAITSHEGRDFSAIAGAFAGLGYRFGPLVIDAQLFVPQSRKRLFIIGVRQDIAIPQALRDTAHNTAWHPTSIVSAYNRLAPGVREQWIWWNLPAPPQRPENFIDIIEENPQGVNLHSQQETQNLLAMMSQVNLAKVAQARQTGQRMVGGIYRRMRPDGQGARVQRAEVRFDDISGCLRTPSGGSSRQVILIVEGNHTESRLLSPREGARLMGLDDNYILPANYNDAYHLAGDGVAVPVVRHLAANLFEPILAANEQVAQVNPAELAVMAN